MTEGRCAHREQIDFTMIKTKPYLSLTHAAFITNELLNSPTVLQRHSSLVKSSRHRPMMIDTAVNSHQQSMWLIKDSGFMLRKCCL